MSTYTREHVTIELSGGRKETATITVGSDYEITLYEVEVADWWQFTINGALLFHQNERERLYINHDGHLAPVLIRTDREGRPVVIYAYPAGNTGFTLVSLDEVCYDASKAMFLCDSETDINGPFVVCRLGNPYTTVATFEENRYGREVGTRKPRAVSYVEVWQALRAIT